MILCTYFVDRSLGGCVLISWRRVCTLLLCVHCVVCVWTSQVDMLKHILLALCGAGAWRSDTEQRSDSPQAVECVRVARAEDHSCRRYKLSSEGEIMASRHVLVLPPSESCKSRVRTESR